MSSKNYTPKERYVSSFVGLAIFGLLGIFLFYQGISGYFAGSSPQQFAKLQGTVVKAPYVTTGKNKSIEFMIDSIPRFTFQVSAATREITKNRELLDEVEIGDTLLITIDRNDYCFKIKQDCKSTFWTRNINFRWIGVVALSKGKKEYINLNSYIRHRERYGIFGILTGLAIFIATFLTGRYERRWYLKNRGL